MIEETDGIPPEQAKEMGLFPKYDVINRVTGELVTEPVFVLKPDGDPMARAALMTYADEARRAGFKALAADLDRWTNELFAREEAEETKRFAEAELARIEFRLRGLPD